MTWISDIISKFAGKSPSKEDSGIRIADEGICIDGDVLKLKTGDPLLVSYRFASNLEKWHHVEVEFQPQTLNTLFIYTDERVADVTVVRKRDALNQVSLRRVPAWIKHDDDNSFDDCRLNDLLDPMNPLSPRSPFYRWNVSTPDSFLGEFNRTTSSDEFVAAELVDPFKGPDPLEFPEATSPAVQYDSGFQSSDYSEAVVDSPFSSSSVTIYGSNGAEEVKAEVGSDDPFSLISEEKEEGTPDSEIQDSQSSSDTDSSSGVDAHSEDPSAY